MIDSGEPVKTSATPLRKLGFMVSKFSLRRFFFQIAAFCFGVVQVALGIGISAHFTFEPLQLISGEAWAFGPRELAHFTGYSGCVLVVWSTLRFYASKAAAWIPHVLAGLGVTTLLLYHLGSPEVRASIGSTRVTVLCQMMPMYLGGCYLMSHVRQHSELLRPKPALAVSVLLLVSMSLIWEVVVQPFFSVYGGSSRGFVQISQLICDMAGAVVGSVLTAPFVRWSSDRKPSHHLFCQSLRTSSITTE